MKSMDRGDDSLKRLDRLLYPGSAGWSDGRLKVGSGHEIYFEQSGRPDGLPVVLLHGGPGAGRSPIMARFFDPSTFRVISFDQRRAGRSQPAGRLEANTTAHLIADVEALRKRLRIPSWLVCGGSWGATLALAYGAAHPDRCLGFLLRSVSLGRESEYRWWSDGVRYFFPESWDRFAGHVGEAERDGLIAAYGRRLESDDLRVSGPAAIEWHRYQAACGSLRPERSRKLETASLPELVRMAKIGAHYFLNNAFLDEDWIVANKDRFIHLPASIVHGRYDVICPPVIAYELADGWSAARLRIVEASGHGATEYALAEAFLEEAERAKLWAGAPPAANSA